MLKEIERFKAKSANGDVYVVVERQHMTTHRPVNGRAQQVGGAVDSITACGLHLNWIEDGVYEVLDTGQRITRCD